MAIAPEYQGGLQPAVGAGVSGVSFKPMAAPKVDLLTGVEKAVGELGRYQAKLQAEIDDAVATDAENAIIRRKAELQNEFLQLKGQNALAADKDGQSPTDRTLNTFNEFTSELMKGKTKSQQDLIKKLSGKHYNGLYAGCMDHARQENYAYTVQSYEGSISSYQQQAFQYFDKPDFVAEALGGAVESARKLSAATGKPSEAVVREAVMGVNNQVLLGFLTAADSNPSYYAQGLEYLKKNSKAISPKDIMAFGARFNAGMKDAQAKKTADMLSESLIQQPGSFEIGGGQFTSAANTDPRYALTMGLSGDFFEKLPDGRVRVSERRVGGQIGYGRYGLTKDRAEAALGRKLTGDEWKSLREDETQNTDVSAAYLGVLMQKYGDLDKALAAFVGSDKAVDDAMKKAKDGGTWFDHLPEAVRGSYVKVKQNIDWSRSRPMTDAEGNEISPLRPEAAQSAFRFASRKEIEDAVRKADPLAVDRDYLEKVVNEVEQKQQQAYQDFRRARETALDDALTLVEQGKEIPQSLQAKLGVRDLQAVQAYRKKSLAGDKSGDYHYGIYLLKNPVQIHNMNQQQLRNALRILDKASAKLVEKEWYANKAQTDAQMAARWSAQNGGQPIGKTVVTMEMVEKVFKRYAGFNKMPDEQKNALCFEFMRMASESNAMYGVDLSNTQKAELWLADFADGNFRTDPLVFGLFGKEKPWISFKFSDYDKDVQKIGKTLAERYKGRNVGSASEGEAVAALNRIKFHKYHGIDVRGILTAEQIDEVRNARIADLRKERRAWADDSIVAQVDEEMKNDTNVLLAFLHLRHRKI